MLRGMVWLIAVPMLICSTPFVSPGDTKAEISMIKLLMGRWKLVINRSVYWNVLLNIIYTDVFLRKMKVL